MEYWLRRLPFRTPEDRARSRRPPLQVAADLTHYTDGLRAWRVAGEHHVKICKMALFETCVEVTNLLCRGFRAFELLVACVIACESDGYKEL